MRYLIISLLLTVTSSFALADFVERKIHYNDGATNFTGILIHDEDVDKDAPAILMIPNWMGVTENAVTKAKLLAEDDYVIFIADMYGTDVRPSNSSEAGKAAGAVRADRAMMRERAQLALDIFLAMDLPIDREKVAAIGFCFGGGAVLEFARSGVDIDAVVSFHGDLLSPTLEADAAATKAKVLVLHGAVDPVVPQSDVQQFVDTMLATDADWQLIQYSQAVHSFTNPEANSPGRSQYDATTAERAFESMFDLFDEMWD